MIQSKSTQLKTKQVTRIDSEHLTFDFGGHSVRVVKKIGEFWSVGKDVVVF